MPNSGESHCLPESTYLRKSIKKNNHWSNININPEKTTLKRLLPDPISDTNPIWILSTFWLFWKWLASLYSVFCLLCILYSGSETHFDHPQSKTHLEFWISNNWRAPVFLYMKQIRTCKFLYFISLDIYNWNVSLIPWDSG